MTTTRSKSLCLVLALLCLCLPACKTGSTLRSDDIKPQPPRVTCKQPATAPTPTAPRANEWVVGGQLSEKAANWIVDVLGLRNLERKYRTVEHTCLDDAEKKGLIQQ